MALKERLVALLADLLGAIAAVLEVADANRGTLVVAYTHGQPAQPTTYGHYLGALVELLLRDVERLRQASRYPDMSSMGAAAITTSGFPLDRAATAELLGFAEVQDNAYGCIAANDYLTSVYGALQLLFVHLGRFAQDLGAWTAFEVGHLHVPDAYVQVSSIMPQKRNPVAVEHLRLLCSLAAGRAGATLAALHNTPFTDVNDAEGEVQVAGYAAFEAGSRALRLLAGFVRAARVDEARVRRHIDESCITATELADSLVRSEGISFRQAHEVVSRLVRGMLDRGERFPTVAHAAFADAFAAIVGRPPRLGEADLRRYTTPEHFVAVRTLPGGPAPGPLEASLTRYRSELGRRPELARRLPGADRGRRSPAGRAGAPPDGGLGAGPALAQRARWSRRCAAISARISAVTVAARSALIWPGSCSRPSARNSERDRVVATDADGDDLPGHQRRHRRLDALEGLRQVPRGRRPRRRSPRSRTPRRRSGPGRD